MEILVSALTSLFTIYIMSVLLYKDFNIKRGFYKWYKKHSYWEYYATELEKMRSKIKETDELYKKLCDLKKEKN